MYLAIPWSALIFQCINSLNIAQFVVRMRHNKNHVMRHSKKRFCGLEGFSLNPTIFKILLIMDTDFTFRLNLQNFLATLLIFSCPWALYIPTLYIISGIAQYLVHSNLSLLLGCQLLIFFTGQAAGQSTFSHSPRSQLQGHVGVTPPSPTYTYIF